MKQGKNCEACFMPFDKDPGVQEDERYCSYCYNNGHLNAEGVPLEKFQAKVYEGMVANGIPKWKAKFFAWTIRFAPYWKNRA